MVTIGLDGAGPRIGALTGCVSMPPATPQRPLQAQPPTPQPLLTQVNRQAQKAPACRSPLRHSGTLSTYCPLDPTVTILSHPNAGTSRACYRYRASRCWATELPQQYPVRCRCAPVESCRDHTRPTRRAAPPWPLRRTADPQSREAAQPAIMGGEPGCKGHWRHSRSRTEALDRGATQA